MYNHSIEVAQLAGLMAAEIGEDVATAKRAGLLHDLGKAVDHEVELPRHHRRGAGPEVQGEQRGVHAIHAHHNDVEPQTVIACLVQAADATFRRPTRARRENLENYIKRLEKLEEVASSFDGVESCYAIQAAARSALWCAPKGQRRADDTAGPGDLQKD